MRPTRLELVGFAAFRELVEIDFADANLIAFVGPTGAGKSSILDGIGFALFGSVARLGRAKAVAPIVNQQSNEARVRLDFEVAGKAYTAVRVVRRTASGATTKEARLEHDGEVVAGTAAELDTAVQELLGLTFDQFTKTVMLPQGDFARFLNETPKERQALLRRLLGMELYSAVGQAARQRAGEAKLRSEVLAEQRAALPDIDSAALKALTKHSVSLSKLKAKAEKLDAKFVSGEEQLAPLVAECDAIDEALEAMAALSLPSDMTELCNDIADQTLSLIHISEPTRPY